MNSPHSLPLRDDESPYIALLENENPSPETQQGRRRRPIVGVIGIVASVLFLLSLVGLIIFQNPTSSEQPNREPSSSSTPVNPEKTAPPIRGVADRSFSDELESSYNWTNAMFSWQRTAFHFQPQKNWMNDPNGPLYHLGWYHLFYQYNPFSAVWGNITWGHAVSRDLIHWLYLPIAMYPDQWYDFNGTWTGSATILPNGTILMLYTGATAPSVQVQCLAYPANQSDPLLLNWTKYDYNPVIVPPLGLEPDEFRDPTTAWLGPDGTWRITIGTKVNDTGMALIYSTTDFFNYTEADNLLHAVDGTGMWECVDFYPVSTNSSEGLDTSTVVGPNVKYVLKASLDDLKQDYYAIGTYDPVNNTWTPDNPEADVGIGLMVDYGRYYASKTFFDQNTGRRILWGWINETDSASDDLKKGWASLQTIPRVVTYDNATGANILQWPVEEIESLRINSTEFEDIELGPGSIIPLDIGTATQLDISAEFEISTDALQAAIVLESEYGSKCGTSYNQSTLGPFGLAVLADDSFSELTPVYFHVAMNSSSGDYYTFFCIDETRSSKAPESEVFKQVYGGPVTIIDGEKFTMRILVDHSIVEGYAQGGRTVISSRVYPTEAIYGAAKLYLFNNATGVNVTATVKVWEMDSANIRSFPLDQIKTFI